MKKPTSAVFSSVLLLSLTFFSVFWLSLLENRLQLPCFQCFSDIISSFSYTSFSLPPTRTAVPDFTPTLIDSIIIQTMGSKDAAKRNAQMSPESFRALVTEEINATKTDLTDVFKQIQNEFKKVVNKLDALDQRMEDMEKKLSGIPSWWNPETHMNNEMKEICSNDVSCAELSFASFTLAESVKAMNKARNAVLENLIDIEERKPGKEKLDQDRQFVNDVCERGNLTKPIEIWREPSKNLTKPRVLKLKFTTTEERNNFLFNARKNMPVTISGRKPTIRRDMTRTELILLHKLRSIIYEKNLADGQTTWYLRDLTVARCTNPRPFHPRR